MMLIMWQPIVVGRLVVPNEPEMVRSYNCLDRQEFASTGMRCLLKTGKLHQEWQVMPAGLFGYSNYHLFGQTFVIQEVHLEFVWRTWDLKRSLKMVCRGKVNWNKSHFLYPTAIDAIRSRVVFEGTTICYVSLKFRSSKKMFYDRL